LAVGVAIASGRPMSAARFGAALFAFAAVVACLRADAQTLQWTCENYQLPGTQTAGSDFTVKIWFFTFEQPHGFITPHRVPSLRVSIVKGGLHPGDPEQVVATGETDAQGLAGFHGIPPGKYGIRLGAEHSIRVNEIIGQGAIEVVSSRAENTEVDFRWPEKSYSARHFRGWLMVRRQPREKPIALDLGLVQLFDWNSGREIDRTYTNAEGYYEFPSAKPGAYWVRFNVKPDTPRSSYDMAAVISDDATWEHIPALQEDPCNGLWVY
jgi:hypothetical protein